MRFTIPLTSFIVLSLTACSPHLHIQSHTQQQYVVKGSGSTGDSSITTMLQPYKRGVDTQMTVVIGHTDEPLTKAQPESTLGNFMADAQLAAAKRVDPKTVAAISNYGGIRIAYVNPGPITRGKIYELMPFDNMLTIAEIPGHVLREVCDGMAARKGWPVSGITFTIKDKKATDITVGGQPLNDAIVYTIAISDYIARGGDNMDMLVPLKKRYTTFFIRDGLIDYIVALEKEGKPLHPVLDKRVSYAE